MTTDECRFALVGDLVTSFGEPNVSSRERSLVQCYTAGIYFYRIDKVPRVGSQEKILEFDVEAYLTFFGEDIIL